MTKPLDAECAKFGYSIVSEITGGQPLQKSNKSKLENAITKALGVLQEDGVYAMFLFLDYFADQRESKIETSESDEVTEIAKEIETQCQALLREIDGPTGEKLLRERRPDERNIYAALRELTEELSPLLFARELLEQTLIYARYHAKATEVQDDAAGAGTPQANMTQVEEGSGP